MDETKIYIVDDHQLIIDGVKLMLADTPYKIIGESVTASKVLHEIEELKPSIVITDISMPDITGVELSRVLKQKYPSVKILVLSMFDNPTLLNELLDSNIAGFVLKNKGKEELIYAIEQVSKGQVYFSAEIMQHLLSLRKSSDLPRLTLREIEIIKLLDTGLNSLQMAKRLFISENTVETHRRNVLRKTNTHSATELLRYARDNKVI